MLNKNTSIAANQAKHNAKVVGYEKTRLLELMFASSEELI